MGFNNESVDTSITHTAEITRQATQTFIEAAQSIIINSSDDLLEVLELYFKKTAETIGIEELVIILITAKQSSTVW